MHPLLGLLIAAVIVALIAYLLMRLFRHWQTPVAAATVGSAPSTAVAAPAAASDPALAELRLRYARGEVSRDDFLQISADLTGAVPPATPAPPASPSAPTPPPATPPAGYPPAATSPSE